MVEKVHSKISTNNAHAHSNTVVETIIIVEFGSFLGLLEQFSRYEIMENCRKFCC